MKVLAKMQAARDRLQAELQGDPRFAELQKLNEAIAVVSRFEPASKQAAALQKMEAFGAMMGQGNGHGATNGNGHVNETSTLQDVVLHVMKDAGVPLFLDELFKRVNTIRPTTRNSVGQATHHLSHQKKLLRAPGRIGLVGLPGTKKQLKEMAKARMTSPASDAATAVAPAE